MFARCLLQLTGQVLLAGAGFAAVATVQAAPASSGRDAADSAIVPQYADVNLKRQLLSEDQIAAALQRLPGWRAEDGRLRKTFVRKNFLDAIAFINALVPECERLDHHPEIFTVYNKVNLTLTTYDAGQRISTFDVQLAEKCEAIAER